MIYFFLSYLWPCLNNGHARALWFALSEQQRRGSPLTCVCSPQEAEGSLPYLLVLCGDHGMSETGSHGGSSEPEVNTPLVLISPAFKRKGKLPTDEEGKQICYEAEEPK